MLLGLEAGLLQRLRGADRAEPAAPLPVRAGLARMILMLALYVGLKLLGLPRLARYFTLALVASFRIRTQE